MSLELVDQGSLIRPGPIGRLVRLSLGVLCLYGLWELINVAPDFMPRPVELLPNLSLMIVVVLCVFNYVVNIGFSKGWSCYPVVTSIIILGLVAIFSIFTTGSANSALLGLPILLWMGYFYLHLGVSFVLASMLATPGCEMRAVPELLGKILNLQTKEHHCPSSIVSGLDRWEEGLKKRKE